MKLAKYFSIIVFSSIFFYGVPGFYLLPLATYQGDLTRIGLLPESEFGWRPIDGLFQRRRLGVRVGFAEMPQQQRKFVASQPADHIGRAHLTLQLGHDCLQHFVAGAVPERVVDRL